MEVPKRHAGAKSVMSLLYVEPIVQSRVVLGHTVHDRRFLFHCGRKSTSTSTNTSSFRMTQADVMGSTTLED